MTEQTKTQTHTHPDGTTHSHPFDNPEHTHSGGQTGDVSETAQTHTHEHTHPDGTTHTHEHQHGESGDHQHENQS